MYLWLRLRYCTSPFFLLRARAGSDLRTSGADYRCKAIAWEKCFIARPARGLRKGKNPPVSSEIQGVESHRAEESTPPGFSSCAGFPACRPRVPAGSMSVVFCFPWWCVGAFTVRNELQQNARFFSLLSVQSGIALYMAPIILKRLKLKKCKTY